MTPPAIAITSLALNGENLNVELSLEILLDED
jgi:hypothetical protein